MVTFVLRVLVLCLCLLGWFTIRALTFAQFSTLVLVRFTLVLGHGGLFVLGWIGWLDAEDIVSA